MEAVKGLFYLVLALSLFAVPIGVGGWILRPLDRAARNRRKPLRFTVLDVLGLVFLLQVPLCFVNAVTAGSGQARPVLSGCGCLVSAVIWFAGVKTFSNAGIDHASSRGLLVFVALPMAYFGSFALVPIPLFLCTAPPASKTAFTGLVVVEFALIALAVFSGRLTRRIVAATGGTGPPDPPGV